MEIIEKKLSEITPYEKNPRMNDGAVEGVAESIRQYGFRQPIIIDKKGVIVCGHTRYKAAQLLNLDSAPCIIADDLTDDQIKAFRIADNKTSDMSIWDNKLLLDELDSLPDDLFTGFDMGSVFDELDEGDSEAVDDNEEGIAYEVKFRSEDKEKIDAVTAYWEGLAGEE